MSCDLCRALGLGQQLGRDWGFSGWGWGRRASGPWLAGFLWAEWSLSSGLQPPLVVRLRGDPGTHSVNSR